MISQKTKCYTLANFILLILFWASFYSCTEDFDSLNTPKDKITTDQIDLTLVGQAFANAIYNGLQGSRGGWELCHELHTDIYAQIVATTSKGFDTDQYRNVDSWVNSCWNSFYSGPAVQIDFVKDFTAEKDMNVENAVAKIWTIPMYQRMTDLWGPIPYSEFGNNETSVVYDSQEDIYLDFFSILDEAIPVLEQNVGTSPFNNNDLIYQGDVQKWITYANSLRLRAAVRLSYVQPDLAQSEAEKAVAGGVMTSNSDNAILSTTDKSVNLVIQWTYINPYVMSATTESLLKGYDDPRLPFYWNEGGGRLGGGMGYHGLRNGVPRSFKTSAVRSGAAGYSFVDDQYFPLADGGPNPPFPYMNAAQVYFLRAEGALRGWDMGGTAKEFYNKGIRMSLKFRTDASESDINDYVTSTKTPSPVHDIVTDGAFNTPPESDIPVLFQEGADFETKLEQIITQKFLSALRNGWELWAERRRTGYPRGYAIINSLSEIPRDALIRRLSYPSGEFSSNNKAVEEAISTFLNGSNKRTKRLWWDKKPLSDYPDLSGTIVDYP